MIDFNCSICGEALSVPSSLAGQKQNCPTCGVQLAVPAGESQATPDHGGVIWIRCTGCSGAIRTHRRHAGEKMRCHACGKKMRIPEIKEATDGEEQLETAEPLPVGTTGEVELESDGPGDRPVPVVDDVHESPVEPAAAEPAAARVEQVELAELAEPVEAEQTEFEPVEQVEPEQVKVEQVEDEQVEVEQVEVEQVEVEQVEVEQAEDEPVEAEQVEDEPVEVEQVEDEPVEADVAGVADEVAPEPDNLDEAPAPIMDDGQARPVKLVPKGSPADQADPGDGALSAFEAAWRGQVSRARARRQEYIADRGVDAYSGWNVDEDDPLLCWEARRYDETAPCEDCQDRDGTIRKASEWRSLGVPGAGLTACGGACRCTLKLEPELGKEDFSTGTIGFALRPTGQTCRESDGRWDRELVRVTPESMIPTILDRWADLRRARSVAWSRLEDEIRAMCGDVPDRHLVHALSVALDGLRAKRPKMLARQWEILNRADRGAGLAAAVGSAHYGRVVEFLEGAYLAHVSEMMQETMDEAADAAGASETDKASCWQEAKEIIIAAADEFSLELPGLSERVGQYAAECDRNALRLGK